MAALSQSAGRDSDPPTSVILYKYRELTEYLAATENFLSELEREFAKLQAQAKGEDPVGPSKFSVLYAKYDAAQKKFELGERSRKGRTVVESEQRAIEKDIETLQQGQEKIENLKLQFLLPQAQGDSSSEGGGRQGADAVTR